MYIKYKLIRSKHVLHAIKFSSIPCVKKIHSINSKNNQNLILRNRLQAHHPIFRQPHREFSLVFKGIRGLLKLRYILLGSAVGGGYQVKKKYDEFISGLPETQWISDSISKVFKDTDTKWINDSMSNITTRINSISENTLNWIKEAKEAQQKAALQQDEDYINEEDTESFKKNSKTNKKLQEELIEQEIKYKRKLEHLEKEKEDLKRQLLLMKGDKKVRERSNEKPLSKSLIDLYSEVLDELHDYDSPYDVQDMLPRVVVVGDQSAGKTSVLEMVANARIFPRGQGNYLDLIYLTNDY